MHVLEEELQAYSLANEWGSAGTMLQLFIFLFSAFATKQTFSHIAQRQDDFGMSVVCIFPIAFNVFVQLMKFYFFTKLKFK